MDMLVSGVAYLSKMFLGEGIFITIEKEEQGDGPGLVCHSW